MTFQLNYSTLHPNRSTREAVQDGINLFERADAMDDMFTFSAKLEAKLSEQQTSQYPADNDGLVWRRVPASTEAEARQNLVRMFLKEGYFVRTLRLQDQEHPRGSEG